MCGLTAMSPLHREFACTALSGKMNRNMPATLRLLPPCPQKRIFLGGFQHSDTVYEAVWDGG